MVSHLVVSGLCSGTLMNTRVFVLQHYFVKFVISVMLCSHTEIHFLTVAIDCANVYMYLCVVSSASWFSIKLHISAVISVHQLQ